MPKRTRPVQDRLRTWRQIVAVAPDHARARERLGHVQTAEGPWLLAESLTTPTRRAKLEARARAAIRDADPGRTSRPNRDENAAGVGWKTIVQGPRVRLAGTPPASEIVQAHALADATFGIFPDIYGAPAPKLPGLTLYLLARTEERTQLLKGHPRSTRAFREGSGTLSSAWLPKSNIVYALSGRKERRFEWSTRQPLAALLRSAYKIRSKQGWAFEGFGLYASHLLCGQRTTFYVRRTDYSEGGPTKGDLWERLKAVDADWRAEARTLYDQGTVPDLRLLLGKGVNTMTTEDLLLSYVLAAWLIEARPDRIPAILRDVAKAVPADRMVEQRLGLDVDGLSARLGRWLRETR